MDATWLSVFPPTPPAVYLRRPARRLPFPLDRQETRLYSRARSGLAAGLRALGTGDGDEVLAPAFHHGSEIEALAGAGIALRFYDAHPGLAPDPDELEGLLTPRTRALYVIHLWGFPQDEPRWREWCDERGLLLIEDGAHAFLATGAGGEPVGGRGDLSIFCAYKTFGLPDGGLAWCRAPVEPPPAEARSGLARLERSHRNWLAQRIRPLARLRASSRWAHEQVEDPAVDFAVGEPEPPSRATAFLLPRIARPVAAARRRANFRRLEAELGELRSPAFPPLPEGASPAGFPIETDAKEHVLEQLAERHVIDGRMWMTPHPALPVERFPGAARLRARLVALPVHQELRPGDLDRIAAAARAAAA
jgi:dTDP-4-amino-4,6-dideoxygalactose transaminase